MRYRLLPNVLYTMSYVVDWRSNVSSKTQRRDPVEDRGVKLWPGIGNRGALMACVFNDTRDCTHSVFCFVHVLRVRLQAGGARWRASVFATCLCPQFCWAWGAPLLNSVAS